MSEQSGPGTARPVVVGYDGSESAQLALGWAAREAVDGGLPLRVVVVHDSAYDAAWAEDAVWADGAVGAGVPTPARLGAGPSAALAARAVDEVARQVAEEGVRRAETLVGRGLHAQRVVRSGPVAATLVEAAADGAMLVLGTRGHVGPLGALLGSISRGCARSASVPLVLLGPSAGQVAERRVVLSAPDGVVASSAARWAVERSVQRERDLLLLDCWGVQAIATDLTFGEQRGLALREAQERHEASLAELRRQVDGHAAVTGRLVEGQAPDVEYQATHPSDLLVVGLADRSHWPALRYERCPVVLVP